MGTILAVCVSARKGVQKEAVESARVIENHGIEGDAHAGDWHRQISLLSAEKIEAFRAKARMWPMARLARILWFPALISARFPWERACAAGAFCWK